MADTVIGVSLQADDQVSPKVKNIKQQLKEAQTEVMTLSEKFGATSKEAAAAAAKTAELKDAIGDARSLVDAFNPDTKFKAFGAAINTVVGGFTALTGSMTLLGVESEDVQKTLLKVQSALAISQGVAQLQEGIQSFKNLKSVLINTLGKSGAIGLAIAGVAALGYAIYETFINTENLTKEQKKYNEVSKAAIEKDGDRIATLEILIDKIKTGSLTQRQKNDTLKEFNEKLGDSLGKYKDYQSLEKAMIDNGGEYINYLYTKAKAEAAYGMLVEANKKAFEKEKENLSNFGNRWDMVVDQGVLSLFFDSKKEYQEKNKKMAIDNANSEVEAVKSIYKQASAEADAQKKKLNIVTTTGKDGTKTKNNESPDVIAEAEKRIKIRREAEEADRERNAMMDKHMRSRELITDQNNFVVKSAVDLHSVTTELDNAKTRNEEANTNARIKLSAAEKESKLKDFEAVGNTLGTLGELFGQQTTAGKVLGIASATINTYVGANKALAQGGIAGIAGAVAVIATGLMNVKKIISVKVPGGGGGGFMPPPPVSAPLQAQLPQAATTRLDQNSLNQIGNATTRAFVVESDVTGNQERIRRLNRAARLG